MGGHSRILSHEASIPKNHTRFPLSPRQTVREVFPHTAYLWEFRDTSLIVPSEVAELLWALKASSNTPVLPLFRDTHSRSPSLPRSYVVSGINSTMTPSDSLPDSPGFRTLPYTRSLLHTSSGMGPEGPPQLTRPLSRHVAPDTPEEPRAASPVLYPEILASPLRYRVALPNLVFTRLHIGSLALQPAGSRRLLKRLCRAA